jgi:hypothetical protein
LTRIPAWFNLRIFRITKYTASERTMGDELRHRKRLFKVVGGVPVKATFKHLGLNFEGNSLLSLALMEDQYEKA